MGEPANAKVMCLDQPLLNIYANRQHTCNYCWVDIANVKERGVHKVLRGDLAGRHRRGWQWPTLGFVKSTIDICVLETVFINYRLIRNPCHFVCEIAIAYSLIVHLGLPPCFVFVGLPNLLRTGFSLGLCNERDHYCQESLFLHGRPLLGLPLTWHACQDQGGENVRQSQVLFFSYRGFCYYPQCAAPVGIYTISN